MSFSHERIYNIVNEEDLAVLMRDSREISRWFDLIFDGFDGRLPLGKPLDPVCACTLICGKIPYLFQIRGIDPGLFRRLDRFDKDVERVRHVDIFPLSRGPDADGRNRKFSFRKFFSYLIHIHLSNKDISNRDEYKSYLSTWLAAKALSEFRPEVRHPVIDRMYHLYECGYLPLAWVGTVERGYAVAWCPPDHPYPEVPEACRVTPEQVAEAETPLPVQAPLPLPVVEEPVVPLPSATAVAADPAEAFRERFAILADSELGSALLARVAERVASVEATARSLVVRFHPTPEDPDWDLSMFGRQSKARIVLKASAPYAKALGPLPPSLARILRRHNGISFGDRLGSDALLAYDGQGCKADSWVYEPDVYDPKEPFRTEPLIPFRYDGEWIACHPYRHRIPGEPFLVRISHDTGRPRDPIPFSIAELLLRSLAAKVLGHHIGQQEGWHLPYGC